jgi:hypothetical protein
MLSVQGTNFPRNFFDDTFLKASEEKETDFPFYFVMLMGEKRLGDPFSLFFRLLKLGDWSDKRKA